jgi:outer membrane protein OmpA-like peptidoglycan-associated protein
MTSRNMTSRNMTSRNMTPRIFLCLGLLMGAVGCSQDRVLLLPGADGQASSGAVAILSAKGDTRAVINQAYADASIGSDSVEQNISDAATVEKKYGALIKALPLPPKPFVLYFREGTTNLTEKSLLALENMFAEIKARPGADVQVIGHTSTLGSARRNDELSLQRATRIKKLLELRGLEEAMVRAAGRGERELLVKTKDGVRNARNRRVEILVR